MRHWLRMAVLSLTVVMLAPIGTVAQDMATPEASPVTVEVDPNIPVLAYYYIWFDNRSWGRAKTDYPVLGPYSSDDREVVRQHMQWAKQAGIDGFIVSWKSTDVLDRRMELLVEVATDEDFKLVVIYQGLDFNRDPILPEIIAEDLDLFIQVYGNEPVFNLFGKPMVIWSGTWQFNREEVRLVTEGRRDHLLILASERTAGAYQHLSDLVDGDAYYWSSVNPETHPGYDEKLAEMARVIHQNNGIWIAPAAPGFDARMIGGTRVIARKGGATFMRQLGAAYASKPDAVGLISWNEFSENSHIEPSCLYGTMGLEVIAALTGGDAPEGVARCSPDEIAEQIAEGIVVIDSGDMDGQVVTEADAGDSPTTRAVRNDDVAVMASVNAQLREDFDSSSPGDTGSGFRNIVFLSLLALGTVLSIAVLARRDRQPPEEPPPPPLEQQVQGLQ